jgi:hypothetical protein
LPAITEPSPSHSEPQKVKIVLRATPASAHFRIDEGPELPNPYVADLPKSATPHTVVAQAPGYRDHVREVRFDRSQTVDLVLEASASGKSSSANGVRAPSPTAPAPP